jgi:CubicO group peptidase (beta-lactamase class C family)
MAGMAAILDDWQVGPRNRWAYQHVDEVVATVVVARGREATPLEPGEPIEVSAPPFMDGIAVLRGGRLVCERYANGMRPDTRHLSQSVAKSVLGLLFTTLGLDASTPVTELVPEVAASGYRGATLRHLLDMTAATDFVEDYLSFWRYDAACGWHSPAPGVPGSILEFLASEIGPAGRPHGERFHYCSPNTDLLGIAVARAGGAPLPELISRHLWQGAEHDALLAVDPAGTAVISGGFCATLRDYVRIGLLARDAAPRVERPIDDPRATAYGTHWWRLDPGTIAARGIHGQLITVGADAVSVVLSSWPAATDPRLEDAQFGQWLATAL